MSSTRPSHPAAPASRFGPDLVWAATLSVAAAILVAAGDALPGPRAITIDALHDWLTGREALVTIAGAARCTALLLVAYLVVLTCAGWLCRLAGLHGLGRVVVRLTLPAFRRAVGGVAGVTLTVLPLGGTALAESAPPVAIEESVVVDTTTTIAREGRANHEGHQRVIMRALDDDTPPPTVRSEPTAPPPPTAESPGASEQGPTVVMRLIGESPPLQVAPTTTGVPAESPSAAEPADRPPSDASFPVGPSDPGGPVGAADATSMTRTIETGDHLWKISEQALHQAWQRSPSDAEILSYLAELIELNRGVLVVPDEPDLVYPGQVFTLPAVPA